MNDVQRPSGPRTEGPDADGFHHIFFGGDGFNGIYGEMLCRPEGEHVARVRIATGAGRSNPIGVLHGGFLLAFLDQAMFVGPVTMGRLLFGTAVTLNLSTQFVGAGRADQPLDCVVEIVRETGRLMFVRGQVEQGDHIVLSYQSTLRKLGHLAG